MQIPPILHRPPVRSHESRKRRLHTITAQISKVTPHFLPRPRVLMRPAGAAGAIRRTAARKGRRAATAKKTRFARPDCRPEEAPRTGGGRFGHPAITLSTCQRAGTPRPVPAAGATRRGKARRGMHQLVIIYHRQPLSREIPPPPPSPRAMECGARTNPAIPPVNGSRSPELIQPPAGTTDGQASPPLAALQHRLRRGVAATPSNLDLSRMPFA